MAGAEFTAEPYLSVVATSRNDDHGKDMRRRMQCFVDALAAQCKRHRLQTELVLVEWNPPPEKPPLRDALDWPDNGGFCPVRIITVGSDLHSRFRFSDKLPLFQMIAKNVGIRRARGQFVLSTNVDLLFSDELMSFIAEKQLEPGVMYRSDRVDVDRGVPLASECAGVSEQLAYCRSHILRANRRDGTWAPRAAGVVTSTAELVPPQSLQSLRGPGYLYALEARLTKKNADGMCRSLALRALSFARRAVARARKLKAGAKYVSCQLAYSIRNCRIATSASLKAELRLLYDEATLAFRSFPELHTNACGDFMLADRVSWIRMGGHPELEMYSFHIDSLTMHVALAEGMRCVDLPPQLVHYHIEHGGGWTPETENDLYRRMEQRGIPMLRSATLAKLNHRLHRKAQPSFHGAGWGLDGMQLPETVIFHGRP